jgi:hypothetical protein
LLVADCKLGFVCVPEPGGSRKCSASTAALVRTEDAASGAPAARPPIRDSGPDIEAATPPAGNDGGDEADGSTLE